MTDDDDLHDPERWRRLRPYRQKFKPVPFVAAGTLPSTFSSTPVRIQSNGATVAAAYLKLVGADITPKPTVPQEFEICEECGLPIRGEVGEHELTTAHQAALPHSHPPHALSRSSVGLKILESSGWDPEARVGLGREGKEGVRYPVKAVAKENRTGIGVDKEKEKEKDKVRNGRVEKEKTPTMGAKESRIREDQRKKIRAGLANDFRGGVDVEAYLSGQGKVEGLR